MTARAGRSSSFTHEDRPDRPRDEESFLAISTITSFLFVSFRAPLLIVAEGATLPLAAGDDDHRDIGGGGVLLGLPFGVRVVLGGLVPLALARRRPSAAEVGRGEGGGAAAAAAQAPAKAATDSRYPSFI